MGASPGLAQRVERPSSRQHRSRAERSLGDRVTSESNQSTSCWTRISICKAVALCVSCDHPAWNEWNGRRTSRTLVSLTPTHLTPRPTLLGFSGSCGSQSPSLPAGDPEACGSSSKTVYELSSECSSVGSESESWMVVVMSGARSSDSSSGVGPTVVLHGTGHGQSAATSAHD